ncbi:TetR/AcrR family transcriptional regulator [Pseudonocardia sp. TRM90224]|uniref:TetR/AcrR family transcriptional regulator n=1 Tax=Pseudonocardia sp. TRM90224 TaxID=2812678 RepID=UPI001E3CF5B5|nr:TetR/AcrR family transcriptional regulator [Pseudonocardia sp. TRM90224]
MTAPTLRERKKLQTRRSLGDAARRLALQHGVRAVSCEDIAEDAGVSARTFFNYFATKEEAILNGNADFWNVLSAAFRNRPAADPIDVAFLDAAREVLGRDDAPAGGWLRDTRSLCERNPELIAPLLALYDDVGRTIRQIVADRTGTDPERDMYPRLVAGCLVLSWRLAHVEGEEPGSPDRLLAHLEVALRQLSAGINNPAELGS